MDRKLPFRVVYASSEDPDFPASELDVHSSQTRGWQSARCVRTGGTVVHATRARAPRRHRVRAGGSRAQAG